MSTSFSIISGIAPRMDFTGEVSIYRLPDSFYDHLHFEIDLDSTDI